VLAAQGTLAGSQTQTDKFFYARFNPADNTVTLTPLALKGLPVSNYVPEAALSPDGSRLAVTSQSSPARITVYSLPSGAARTWTAGTPGGFTADVIDILSWSRDGTLAFGWAGSAGAPPGEYLLNTNNSGGSLLADSRDALCVPQPPLTWDYRGLPGAGYLTPDGATIISIVPRPIPIGQRPPSCSQMPADLQRTTPKGLRPTRPELEEFSVKTGKATRVLYTSRSRGGRATEVYWSNNSGSVLVIEGKLTPGVEGTWIFGILRGSTFTPIPGSATPPLTGLLAF
jgi:hypothetical protein